MTSHDGSPSQSAPRSFRNDSAQFLPEALGGFVAAHPDAQWHNAGFIGRRSAVTTESGNPKVAVISGGGAGHEPLHAGFLGAGMLDAVCPGQLFTSPNAVQIIEATRWAEQGAGVVHVVKNYTGDVMNFKVARQTLEEIDTRVVLVDDDVATESNANGSADGPGRRGTGATAIVEKIVGAAAQRGDDVDQVARLGKWAADNSRSMAAAIQPGFLPTTGRETFELPAGEMELGVGIHGERGVDRIPAEGTDEVVARLIAGIKESNSRLVEGGAEVICLVNGLGGTTPLELSLTFGSVVRQLSEHGVTVRRGLVGSFVTSVNMAGISLTLTLATDEIVELLDHPTMAPAWPRVIGGQEDEVAYAPAVIDFDDDLPAAGEENSWLGGFIGRVQSNFDELTELDRLAGDGDFGHNMEAAFGDIELPLRGKDSEVLGALAHRLFIRAGGTSGAVMGTLFQELSAAFEESDSSVSALGSGLAKAHAVITELGGARQGDKTLVDALVPAAEAVAALQSETVDFAAALQAAYDAAEQGALDTREAVAKKGRASYVGEASKGVVDPGAIVVAWIFGGEADIAAFTA